MLAASALYVFVYLSSYFAFVVPQYDGWGLGWNEQLSSSTIAFVAFIAALPACFLPVRFERPSDFLLLVQYYLVYIPAVIVAFNSSRPRVDEPQATALVLTLLTGILVIIAGRRFLPVVAISGPKLPRAAFLACFVAAFALTAGYVLVILGTNFRLVSLEEIYALRKSGAELLVETGSSFGGYALAWTSSFFLPMLFAIGMQKRRYVPVVTSVVGFVILYGIWGSKAALLAPFVLALVYLLLRCPASRIVWLFPLGLSLLLVVPSVLIGTSEVETYLREWYVSVVHQRTFSSSALLITQYFDFFIENPRTFGSHVTGISAIVDYPYAIDIPRLIGMHFYGAPMTANANFWAMDGIAGFGLPGIVGTSMLCALVFWLLDTSARRLSIRFSTLCLGYAAMNFADLSIFTMTVTGGLGLFVLAFFILPPSLAGQVRYEKMGRSNERY